MTRMAPKFCYAASSMRLRTSLTTSVLIASLLFWGCPPAHITGTQGQERPPVPRVEDKQRPKAEDMPRPKESPEELYRAGMAHFEAGDYPNARKTFGELLLENPLFDKAAEARRWLGMAALEVGAYQDAYQNLWPLAMSATGDERLLDMAGRAAEGALMFGDALRAAILLAEAAPSQAAQEAAVARVTELVESKAGFIDVATAFEGLSSRNPAWPVLAFKLARIYYHLRDRVHLEEMTLRLQAEAPTYPYTAQAQQMLARFQRREQAFPRRIGVVLPMTGKYGPLGEAVMRGVKLALEGSDIELVVKDTQGDVNVTSKAVEDLVFEDQAIAILGPVLSDDATRAALVAEELQVPILTLTRVEGITDIGPHVFRDMLTNSAQAAALAEYGVNVLGFKSWALLYPNITYGVDLANSFWDELLARGAEVRGAESYSHDQTTFTTEVKKLVGRYYLEDRGDYREQVREIVRDAPNDFRKRKALEKARSSLDPIVDFDAIFIPDEWRRVGLLAPALAVEDIITNACDSWDLERIRRTTGKRNLKTVMLFGSNLWSSPRSKSGLPELVERGGKFVNCSVYVDGFYPDSERAGTQRFVKAFREAYKDLNRDPYLLEASGHDAVGMLRQVLDQQHPRTREELREHLSRLKGYEGAMGTASMSERREAQRPLFFLSIDRKGIQEVSPQRQEGS